MLTPSQVEDYAQRAAAAFDDLELDILTDIARRIAKADYMTEGAKWQAERAKAMGASRQHMAERMERLMAAAAPRVAVIFAQAMLDAEERILTAQYNTKLCEISLQQISGNIGVYLQ